MSSRLYRVLLWFGMAATGIAGLALLQEFPALFAATFAIACLPRPAVDRLELYATHRGCTDLAV